MYLKKLCCSICLMPSNHFYSLMMAFMPLFQKYRIFLKRVMETSSSGTITGKNISERTLRSSFATGHPSLMVNALQRGFPQFLDHQQVGASQLQPRFLGNLPIANASSLSSTIFPNQQASSGNPIPQLGYAYPS